MASKSKYSDYWFTVQNKECNKLLQDKLFELGFTWHSDHEGYKELTRGDIIILDTSDKILMFVSNRSGKARAFLPTIHMYGPERTLADMYSKPFLKHLKDEDNVLRSKRKERV